MGWRLGEGDGMKLGRGEDRIGDWGGRWEAEGRDIFDMEWGGEWI